MTTTTPADIDRRRRLGVGFAATTALISGVAVFTNGYGVRRFDDATTYTTAKNLIAGLVLAGVYLASRRGAGLACRDPVARRSRLGLAFVGVVGGGVPFVLFFEGLQRIASTNAAFIHKTLVVWVAIGAVVWLGERLSGWHGAAIVLLIWGQAELAGGVGWPEAGSGELMILAATLCWSVEVVVSKRLLASIQPLELGVVRMLGGSVVLLAWAVLRGALGDLIQLEASQWGWALLTGGILSGYVASWHQALVRAPAVDVTAVLVFGAVVTAALNGSIRDVDLGPQLPGLVLVTLGVAVVALSPRVWRPKPAVGPR